MTGIQISLSLIADTPENLSAKTVRAQLTWGMELHFYDFTQLKNGNYICWYKMPYSIYQEKVANGKTTN